jgi:hypothetical protein
LLLMVTMLPGTRPQPTVGLEILQLIERQIVLGVRDLNLACCQPGQLLQGTRELPLGILLLGRHQEPPEQEEQAGRAEVLR